MYGVYSVLIRLKVSTDVGNVVKDMKMMTCKRLIISIMLLLIMFDNVAMDRAAQTSAMSVVQRCQDAEEFCRYSAFFCIAMRTEPLCQHNEYCILGATAASVGLRLIRLRLAARQIPTQQPDMV